MMNLALSPARAITAHRPHRLRAALVALAAAGAVVLSAPAADARAIPFSAKPVSINARGQKIDDFLADLFAQAGLKVKVSTAATGQVQGVFVGRANDVWNQISRAYGLVAFYDGSVVRVFSQSEITSRTITAAAPDQVVKEVGRLGLMDSVNSVRAGSGIVLASGVPTFLDHVEGVAGRMRPAPAPAPAVTPTPVATPAVVAAPANPGAIASPILANGWARPVRGPVEWNVLSPATASSPMETRVFRLLYRQPSDQLVRSADQERRIPGVATLLAEQMGVSQGKSSMESNVRGLRDSGVNGYDPAIDGRGDEPPANNAPVIAGGARISADARTRSVIVTDRPNRMALYEALIRELDQEPLVVEIEATLIEVNTSRMRQLGIDWNLGIGGLSAAFGGQITPDTSNGIGGSYVWRGGNFINAQITALQQNGALRVVQRPSLSTVENVEATFDMRGRQTIRITGEREANYREVLYGLLLRVSPTVIDDGRDPRIAMDIEIEDSQLGGAIVEGIPTPVGPRIQTQTMVRLGESVMIAGLARDSEYDYKRKTPLLGDIPIAGQAFRKRNKGGDRYERLFIITPRVVDTRSTSTIARAAAAAPAVPPQVSAPAATPTPVAKPPKRRR